MEGSTPTLPEVSVGFELLMILGVLLSGVFALRATIPSLRQHNSRSLFFFEHIRSLSEDEYIEQFMAMNSQDIKRSVLQKIHAKSSIVGVKFRRLRISMLALVGGFGFWILAQLARALAQ